MFSIANFYLFATAAIICTILVPFVARLSVRIGVLDRPDERKVHFQATPRLGGIAVFCSLLFTLIVFCDINQQLKGVLAGAIIIFLTGLADDVVNLSARHKLAGQIIAASLAVFIGGICVRNLGDPFGLGIIELGPLAVPFTLFGIVGLINAINMLDGLDGLAGGVCTISCVAFAVISYSSGNGALLQLSIALLGCLLGFLRYNHYPAKIFMGDCGSLLLGYFMGVFSVMLATGGTRPVSPYIPLIILGVPILDTLAVMISRKMSGKRLFMPDMSHIHHRLIGLGIEHRGTVLIVFGLSYLLVCFAIFGINLKDSILLSVFLTSAAIVYGALCYLNSRGIRYDDSRLTSISLLASAKIRRVAFGTGCLTITIKYLLLSVLMLPVLIEHQHLRTLFLVPLLIIVIAAFGVYMSQFNWNRIMLQSCIYISGAFMVFVLENYGHDDQLLELPLPVVSNALFLTILILSATKVIVSKRFSKLLVSPFEYLIMLIVLTVPLLPHDLAVQFHLYAVAAKSVVLFVGFKLVLMRQLKRNRKVILAIVLSSLVLIVKNLLAY